MDRVKSVFSEIRGRVGDNLEEDELIVALKGEIEQALDSHISQTEFIRFMLADTMPPSPWSFGAAHPTILIEEPKSLVCLEDSFGAAVVGSQSPMLCAQISSSSDPPIILIHPRNPD